MKENIAQFSKIMIVYSFWDFIIKSKWNISKRFEYNIQKKSKQKKFKVSHITFFFFSNNT